jgi:hypothetical protein
VGDRVSLVFPAVILLPPHEQLLVAVVAVVVWAFSLVWWLWRSSSWLRKANEKTLLVKKK